MLHKAVKMKHLYVFLCSKLTITTCHQGAQVGTKLSFDHHGQILSQSPCPRQVCFICFPV